MMAGPDRNNLTFPGNGPLANLCGLSLLTQNLNSLNVSTHNRQNAKVSHFKQKINAILSKNADIILIQDVRAANKIQTIEKITTCTSNGNYNLIFNSNLSKRGVCILYKNTTDIEVLEVYKSQCQNLLIIKCILNNVLMAIGSVYGPRDLDNPDFFKTVKQKLLDFNCRAFIIGGDMNCVASNIKLIRNVNHVTAPNRTKYFDTNPECLNMTSIPNPKNTDFICENIMDGFWIDPFRSLYPDKRDYSYTPFNKNMKNRSRLDYFLTSPNLQNHVDSITQEPLLSKLFDHKSILLKLGTKCNNPAIKVDNKLVNTYGMREEAALTALLLYNETTEANLTPIIEELNQVVLDLKVLVIHRARLSKLMRS